MTGECEQRDGVPVWLLSLVVLLLTSCTAQELAVSKMVDKTEELGGGTTVRYGRNDITTTYATKLAVCPLRTMHKVRCQANG